MRRLLGSSARLRPDFVSGNTRLRARIPFVRDLADGPPPGREEAARALLRSVPAAYAEPARTLVGVLLARHDLADVTAALRGAMHDQPKSMRRQAMQAVGRVSDQAAVDLADARDGADAIARLSVHALPDPASAAALHRCWEAFELHEDVEELEWSVARAVFGSWQALLDRAGHAAEPIRALLAEERDLSNLRAVLRVGSLERTRLLPPGLLAPADLAAAVRGDWAPLSRIRPRWSAAVRALGSSPSPAAIEARLHAELVGRGPSLLRHGDLYTAEPAVGFVLSVEGAARTHSPAERPSGTGTGTDSRPADIQEPAWAASS